jgi:hypothetical protein
MRRVILESPFAGDIEAHVAYAHRRLRDCLARGEAPIASHLLYPQILDDSIAAERALGIAAGLGWLRLAEAKVAYIDYGISPGMRAAMEAAEKLSLPIERRQLPRFKEFPQPRKSAQPKAPISSASQPTRCSNESNSQV